MAGRTVANRILVIVLGVLVLVSSVVASPLSARAAGTAGMSGFNTPGDMLISDQFNNRAVEIDTSTKQIVWSFGSGNPRLCNPGPHAIIGPNDAERLAGGLTLLSGTGIGPSASPVDPGLGCADNRVIIVNRAGDIVWQYGQAGVAGSGPNQLNVPVFAIQLPNRNIMITDQANSRVIEVDRFTRTIVWTYGPASGPGALTNPNSAELLPNGHVLIADESNNRVLEITRAGRIVWQFGSGDPRVTHPLLLAAFASRLPNGDTLITDSAHSRIVKVTQDKRVTFRYLTNGGANSNPSPLPTNAVRVANGDTVIADQYNHRAIVITPDKHVVFQYGRINDPGSGPGHLDGPYTAFIIGDYTGQTPPPATF